MTAKAAPSLQSLPPSVRELPEVRELRLSSLEHRLDGAEADIKDLKDRPHLPPMTKWPWVHIIASLTMIALALAGHLSPAEVKAIATKKLGL
jgi:hypothetical protein